MASKDLTVNKLINRLSVLKNNDNQNESKIELLEKDINLISERVNEIYYTSREGYLYTFTPEELSNSDIKLSDQNFPKYVVDVYYRTMFFTGLNYSYRSTKYLIFIPRKNDIRDFIIDHTGSVFRRNLSINSLFIFLISIVSSTTGNTFIYIFTPGINVYGNDSRKPGTLETENYIIPIIEKEIKIFSNIRVHAYSQGSNNLLSQDTILNFLANNHNLKEIIFNSASFGSPLPNRIVNTLQETSGPLKLADIIILTLEGYKTLYLRLGKSEEEANKQVLLSDILTIFFLSIFNSTVFPVKYFKKDFIQLWDLYPSFSIIAVELRKLLVIVTGNEPIASLNFGILFHNDELDSEDSKSILEHYSNYYTFSKDYNYPDAKATVCHLFGDQIVPYVVVDDEGNPIAVGSNPEGTTNSLVFLLRVKFGITPVLINDDTLNVYQRELYNKYKDESVHSFIVVLVALNHLIDSSE